MSVLHLFIAILGVLAVSIVLAVINWIVQARLSSRILSLEKEIEKKTLEFHALRKERAAASPPAQPKAAPPEEAARAMDMPIQQQTVNDGAIQIVRNVRGTFSTAQMPMEMTGQEPLPEEPIEATRIDDGPVIRTGRGAGSPPAESPYPDDTRRWRPSAAQQYPEPQPRPEQAGIVIPVYSPAAQGPDLNQLYNSLVATLKAGGNDRITFDLANIQTMSDAEMEYLEKIHWSLAGQGRTLTFVNCSPSLAPAMDRHPQIGSLLR